MNETIKKIKEIIEQYMEGLIMDEEALNKIVYELIIDGVIKQSN
jgi:hypothetical protein